MPDRVSSNKPIGASRRIDPDSDNKAIALALQQMHQAVVDEPLPDDIANLLLRIQDIEADTAPDAAGQSAK